MSNTDELHAAVLDRSRSKNWATARAEWEIASYEDDAGRTQSCVCGQPRLAKLFTIRNELTGEELFPIGSSCIENFGRADLDDEVKVLETLARLRKAMTDGGDFDFGPPLISRALIEHFHDAGVFTPDKWNFGNGDNDRDFLLTMFNKRDDSSVSSGQQRKLQAIFSRKIVPYLKGHSKLR